MNQEQVAKVCNVTDVYDIKWNIVLYISSSPKFNASDICFFGIDICFFGTFLLTVIFFTEILKYKPGKIYTSSRAMQNKIIFFAIITFSLSLISDTWTCAHCKNVNQVLVTSCIKCGTSATKEKKKKKHSLMETLSYKTWECSSCGKLNLLECKTCPDCTWKLAQFSNLADGQHTFRAESEFSPVINEENTRRILIVGIVGSGKSSFANSILGKSMFKATADFCSVTEKAVCGMCKREGTDLVVFDTPGFLGDKLEETHVEVDNIYKIFQSCFWVTCPGFHAIAIVIGIGRFTREDCQVVENIKRIFGQGCMNFVILVFTKIDEIGNRSLEDLITKADDKLRGYLEESHNTYVGINNKAEGEANDKQIKEFLTKVEEVFNRNDRKQCYL